MQSGATAANCPVRAPVGSTLGVHAPRIDSGGTSPLRSLCTRKEALLAATGVPEMIVTHGIYLQYITVKAAPVNR